jgi:mRNA-degrading endonuclease RelE of RelBE toxin-antitoxin system
MTEAELQTCIRSGLAAVAEKALVFEEASDARLRLERLWGDPISVYAVARDPPGVASIAREPAQRYESRPEPKRAPPWLIGFSPDFLKHADKIDKKLQGRVYEAIAELSHANLSPQGDTLKPLGRDYKDCWRYRIGDYRLIFLPNKSAGTMTLMAFLPRGGAYD